MRIKPESESARSLFRRIGVGVLAASLSLQTASPAFAANHAFSAVADVNTLDYVVNVDWDFDNPPTQVGNGSVTLDRAYITNLLRVFAQSNFTMTEGLHKIGKVYVYKNAMFGTNVDIQIINKDGRSNASGGGWRKPGGLTSHNYLTMSTPETFDQVGKVIAHEMGHYTYTLFDEYQEQSKPVDPTNPHMPANVDTPRNTIMHDQNKFVSFSTPADYADPAGRITAQGRVAATGPNAAGASAWEVLTRTPDKDPDTLKIFERTFFDAFKGIDASKLQLKQPVAGFDAKLNIMFVSNPVFRDIILIDRTLSAERLAIAIQGAKAVVSQAKTDTHFMVIASPAVGAGPILPYTKADEAGKTALAAALDAVVPAGTGSFDAIAAFSQGLQALAAARQPGDPSTIHLLTGQETSLPADAANLVKDARVSVNPIAVGGSTKVQQASVREKAKAQSTTGAVINLADIANSSGGAFRTAKDGTDAAKAALRSSNEVHGQTGGTIALNESGALAASAVFNTKFSMANGNVDGNVTIELLFDPIDASKLKVTLTSPSGTVYGLGNLPDGISLNDDSADGVIEFVVSKDFSGRVGSWALTATAVTATQDGLGAEVTTDNTLQLVAYVDGGKTGSGKGPTIKAVLSNDKSVRGAVVTADIFNPDETLALGGVQLIDDGIGQYVANLTGKLAAGEYTVKVYAQTVPGSRIAAVGAPIKGPFNVETPVDPLTRVAESSFTLDVGAVGVIGTTTAAPVAASGGGGCTVSGDGRDAGLLLLLLSALAGVGLRHRRKVIRSDKA